MNREVANLVLLCLGCAAAKTVIDGSYLRYVKPALGPYLLASAVIMIVLAVVAIVRDIRAGHEGGHRHGRDLVLWLLVAPVLVVFFLRPPALTPSDTLPLSNVSAAGPAQFAPLPAQPQPEVSVFEVVQRSMSDGGGLTGRTIAVEGYLQVKDSRVGLAQVVIICCAADAQTFRVELSGPSVSVLRGARERTWWQAVGVVVDGSASEARDYVPELRVTSIRSVPEPDNPYGY